MEATSAVSYIARGAFGSSEYARLWVPLSRLRASTAVGWGTSSTGSSTTGICSGATSNP